MANICSCFVEFEDINEDQEFTNLMNEIQKNSKEFNPTKFKIEDREIELSTLCDLDFYEDTNSGNFQSRWYLQEFELESLKFIADYFKSNFTINLEETGNGIFEKNFYNYKTKEYTIYALSVFEMAEVEYDDVSGFYIYKQKKVESEYDCYEEILDAKITRIKNEKQGRIEKAASLKTPDFDVKELFMSEQEYRALDAVSYSRFSDIEKVGELAVNAPANNNIGKLRGVYLGSVIDNAISLNIKQKVNYFDDNVVFVDKAPGDDSAIMKIINILVDETKEKYFDKVDGMDLLNLITKNRLFINGVTSSNYATKLKNYKSYIDKRLKFKNDQEKIYITKYDKDITEKAIARLRKYKYFDSEFKRENGVVEVFFQKKYLANIGGIEVKCMLDSLIIDHENKTIKIADIKTGALDEQDFKNFVEEAYLRYNYYIQAGLYRKIMVEYFKCHPDYFDYTVLEFEFIYSTTSIRNALKEERLYIHSISEKLYLDSFKGFSEVECGYNCLILKEPKKGIGELFNIYKTHKIFPKKADNSEQN